MAPVSKRDLQWRSSPASFGGRSIAGSFVEGFPGDLENSFPLTPGSAGPEVFFSAAPASSTSADFVVIQKARTVPSPVVSGSWSWEQQGPFPRPIPFLSALHPSRVGCLYIPESSLCLFVVHLCQYFMLSSSW